MVPGGWGGGGQSWIQDWETDGAWCFLSCSTPVPTDHRPDAYPRRRDLLRSSGREAKERNSTRCLFHALFAVFGSQPRPRAHALSHSQSKNSSDPLVQCGATWPRPHPPPPLAAGSEGTFRPRSPALVLSSPTSAPPQVLEGTDQRRGPSVCPGSARSQGRPPRKRHLHSRPPHERSLGPEWRGAGLTLVPGSPSHPRRASGSSDTRGLAAAGVRSGATSLAAGTDCRSDNATLGRGGAGSPVSSPAPPKGPHSAPPPRPPPPEPAFLAPSRRCCREFGST